MYNYVQDLDTFLAKAETLLVKMSLAQIADPSGDEKRLFVLAVSLDTLRALPTLFEETEKERLISFLLDEYCIDQVGIGPYNSYQQIHLHPHGAGGLLPHTHPISEVINLQIELNNRVHVDDITQVVIDDDTLIASSGAVWRALQVLMNNAGGAELEEDVTSAVTEGGITTGDLLLEGMTFTEFVKKFLTARGVPPSVSLSIGGARLVERGTLITNLLTGSFTQNNAGAATLREIIKGSTNMTLTGLFSTNENVVIGVETLSYTARVTYAAGNPALAGAIPAGTITSAPQTIRGAYMYFAGVTSGTTPGTSPAVRGLSLQSLDDKTFDLVVPTNPLARVHIAYPDIYPDLTSGVVLDLSSNITIEDLFTKTTIPVADAQGANLINYKVFTYTPVGGYPIGTILRITLP